MSRLGVMITRKIGLPRFGYKPLILSALGILLLFVLMRLGISLLRQEPIAARVRHEWSGLTGTAQRDQKVRLVLVGEGFQEPTDIQFVPGAHNLALVLQKRGSARLWDLSANRAAEATVVPPGPELFRVAVKVESEMGLLGLAFHPDYQKNGLFYLNTTPEPGERRTRIAEWKATPIAAPSAAQEQRVLLEVAQPYSNHNGGGLAFGKDSLLYIALGDGGHRDDPHGHGQNPKSLLGKILRIDPTPSATGPYAIPADNPFLKKPKFRPEIWAYGLRNPWRFSFTAQGDVITGDVGQDKYEEVDLIRAGDNLGWNVREAGHCFKPAKNCPTAGFVEPIFEYGRSLGTSITGGFVYRGSAVPNLIGQYIFGDFGSGRLWALPIPKQRGGAYGVAEELGQWDAQFSSFGEDASGELYVADFHRGKIYQIRAR